MFLRNEVGRVRADLEGEILGVDSERVEAEGLEHRVPLEPLESSIDVIAREREEVADVKPLCRRVREHHERIERAYAGIEVGVVRPARLPALLPFSLDGGRVVAGRLFGRFWMDRFCHGDSGI